MASRRDIEAGKAHVLLYLKDSALAKGLKRIGGQMQSLGSSMAGFGAKMSLVMAGVAYPIALAVKNFADFDDAMLAVKATSQASAEKWQMLVKTAKDLGAATSYTAVQVASLMVELGRAGFVPDEINAMTGAVLNLARASGTDATLASGIMAASIRQFSLGAADAARVADVLTATANKTFNTVESLGEALSYAGPVAADFGMSMEETLAVLGALGNVGIQGSNAGTALRRMMIITGAEATKLQGIFGVSFRDMAGNARPLVDVFGEINTATAELGTGARAQKFNEAFGLLGITGASVMGRNVGSVRELQTALEQAGGTAAKTAAEMDSGLGGALRILLSAVEGVKISLGNALAPMLIHIGKVLTLVNGVVRNFIDQNQGMMVAIVGVVAALTAAALGMSAFGFAMIGIGAAISTIATVIGAVLSPIGLLIAGIAAGTAAFIHFTDVGHWLAETLMGDFGTAFDTIRNTFRGLADALKAGELQLAGEIAMTGLKLAFMTGTQTIRAIWTQFVKRLVGAVVTAAGMIVTAFANAQKNVAYLWAGMRTEMAEQNKEVALQELESRRGGMGQREYMVARLAILEDAASAELDATQTADRKLGDINATMGDWQASLDEFGAEVDAGLDAGLSDGEARLAALRAQLSGLTTEAATRVAELPGAAPAPSAAQAPGLAAGAAAGGVGMGGTSAVSFSSSALSALGQGGGPMQKLVSVNEEQKKLQQKQLLEQQKMAENLAKMGALFVIS